MNSPTFATLGLSDHDYQQDSRFMTENFLKEFAPNLFPDKMARLPLDMQNGIKSAFTNWQMPEPVEQPMVQPELPQVAPPPPPVQAGPPTFSSDPLAAPEGAFED